MPADSRTDYEVGVSQVQGVELRMAANPTQLSIVRAVAADIAMRQDFDLDAIEDLKLAVDEACSTLITLAAPDAVLSCTFVDRGQRHSGGDPGRHQAVGATGPGQLRLAGADRARRLGEYVGGTAGR